MGLWLKHICCHCCLFKKLENVQALNMVETSPVVPKKRTKLQAHTCTYTHTHTHTSTHCCLY